MKDSIRRWIDPMRMSWWWFILSAVLAGMLGAILVTMPLIAMLGK